MNPEGLFEQSARCLAVTGLVPRRLGLHDQHERPVRSLPALARETMLPFTPLLPRFHTPLPVHVRQIASETVDGVNERRTIREDVCAVSNGLQTQASESNVRPSESESVHGSHVDHGQDVIEADEVRRIASVEVESAGRRGRSDQQIGDTRAT